MSRCALLIWLGVLCLCGGSQGVAGPIAPTSDCGERRDAYVGVLTIDGTYLSNFRLFATGMELVKFGAPPTALTDVSPPTSVADLSGFTVTDPLDHRLVLLAFENLATGGLFAAHGEISVLTITPHPTAPLFELYFEGTISSGFGGLPVTTVSGSYVYNALATPILDVHHLGGEEAHYAMLSHTASLNGTPWNTTGGRIEIEDDLCTYWIPEPATWLLGTLGLAGLVLSRRARPRLFSQRDQIPLM